MNKKVFILLVSLFAIVSGIMVVNAATPDNKPPVLKSISISNQKESYNLGDRVYLNIEANDDVSGLNMAYLDIECTNCESSYSITGVNVEDFLTKKPYFVLDNDMPKGTYEILGLTLDDNNGNTVSYTKTKADTYYENRVYNFNSKFYVNGKSSNNIQNNDNNIDNDTPYLDDFSIDKTVLEYGNKLKITAKAHDETTEVDRVEVYITYENESLPTYVVELRLDKTSGLFVGYLNSPNMNGNYYITAVYVYDIYDNSSMYYVNDSSYGSGTYVLKKNVFKVIKTENVLPSVKITDIKFDYKKLYAPATFKISVKVEDPSNIIDVVYVSLRHENSKDTLRKGVTLKLDDSGYFTGYADIDQYYNIGKYYIGEIYAENSKFGFLNDDQTDYIYRNLKYDKPLLFEVIEDNFYDVFTSTTDKELITKIKEAKNNAKIAINSMNNSIISQEVFEAIQNTNKTIYIESNGIQWVFNGNSIKSPKEIDVNVSINRIYENELSDDIGEYIEKGIVIDFMDNGELPGLALIKVKTDYALRDYLGTEGLQVYHYNGDEEQMFDEVANEISLTKDGNFEFYITHNSSYVISNKKVDSKLISDNKEVKEINDNNLSEDNSVSIDNDEENDNVKTILYICALVFGVAFITTIIVLAIKKKKKSNLTKNVDNSELLKKEESSEPKKVKVKDSNKKSKIDELLDEREK